MLKTRKTEGCFGIGLYWVSFYRRGMSHFPLIPPCSCHIRISHGELTFYIYRIMKAICIGFTLSLMLTLVHKVLCFDEGGANIEHQWSEGFIGKFSITPGPTLSNGWNMIVTFSQPIKILEVWQAKIQMQNKQNTVFVLENQSWNTLLEEGKKFEFNFKATKRGRGNPHVVEVAVGRAEHLKGLSC